MNDHQPASTGTSAVPAPERAAHSNANAPNRLVEFFSLKRHLEAAHRTSFSRTDPGFGDFELGLAALRDGIQLATSQTGRDPALVLLRSATRLLVRATVLRGGARSDAEWPELWQAAMDVPAWSALKESLGPAALAEVTDVVTRDEAYLATLAPSTRASVLANMTACAKRFGAPLEHDATVVSRLVWKRRRRIATTSIVIVGLLAGSIMRLTRQENLALHRPAVVTDREPTFGVDPDHAVDGDRTNLGFHTTLVENATLTIDLGAVKPLRRVDVYNRVDCCQERAVPLVLELSSDGRNYEAVSSTKRKFDVWRVPLPAGTRGRFVRLLHKPRTYFHLSEVEVY